MCTPVWGESVLVPYDHDWPRQFEIAANELRVLGNDEWLIEHIGSTSVPGLAAKPIIDLAVCIRGLDDFNAHRAGLESGGWKVGSRVRTHPVMIYEQNGRHTRIAHFFTRQRWESVNQRVLRDWLREHPADASRYEAAKVAAAQAAWQDGVSYNDAKTRVIQELVTHARAARGLPPATAYDK